MSVISDTSSSTKAPFLDEIEQATLPILSEDFEFYYGKPFRPCYMAKTESRHVRSKSSLSSQSSGSSIRRPRKNPEDLDAEERLSLLEISATNPSITLFTCVPDSDDIIVALWNVPRLMLKAFSPAINAQFKNMDSDQLVLPVTSKDSVICLVNWMMDFCEFPDTDVPIDLGDCSVQEWLTLWDTAKELAIHPATRQLSAQCEEDCRTLCRTQLLEAWLGCKNIGFKEAERILPEELQRRLSETPPEPRLLEHLWDYAKTQNFTKTAVASFATHTLPKFQDGSEVEGFGEFSQSLKGAIYAAWFLEDMRNREVRLEQAGAAAQSDGDTEAHNDGEDLDADDDTEDKTKYERRADQMPSANVAVSLDSKLRPDAEVFTIQRKTWGP